MWTRDEAVLLCQDVREVALKHNYHVALGGSCLHVGHSQKDTDIYFLPMHGIGKPNLEGLLGALDLFWGYAENISKLTELNSEYPPEPGYIAAKKVQWKLDPSKRIDFWVIG